MKKAIVLLITFGVIMATVITHELPFARSATNGNPAGRDKALESFALIELFTSEGCSSCPPADRLLSEIIKEANHHEKNIFALSFHVDYWDYIGWRDPYSDASYSDRQRQYAAAFKTTRIYTPQMIVNGKVEFVGSDRNKSEKAIATALLSKAEVAVYLDDLRISGSTIRLEYDVPELPKNAVINFALVEQALEQQVARGENRGHVLRHDNVVRGFQQSDTRQGTTYLSFPEGLRRENSAVIVYVQNVDDMAVIGAAKILL